jgi:hypothetical protein
LNGHVVDFGFARSPPRLRRRVHRMNGPCNYWYEFGPDPNEWRRPDATDGAKLALVTRATRTDRSGLTEMKQVPMH